MKGKNEYVIGIKYRCRGKEKMMCYAYTIHELKFHLNSYERIEYFVDHSDATVFESLIEAEKQLSEYAIPYFNKIQDRLPKSVKSCEVKVYRLIRSYEEIEYNGWMIT